MSWTDVHTRDSSKTRGNHHAVAQHFRTCIVDTSNVRTIEALLHLNPPANHLLQASRSLDPHRRTKLTFQTKEDGLS